MKILGICLLLATLSCGEYPQSGSSGTADGRPLFVYLHGFGPWGPGKVAAESRMRGYATAEGWDFVAPLGFTDPDGFLYWPASPACCDRYHEGRDGVGRVWAAIQDAQPQGPIFIVGMSNGGFMAHRMACEMPGEITAAISIAGAGSCALEIHGWHDGLVPFDGGALPWFGLEPALPASAAPELWSGPWGHELPEEIVPSMMNYLSNHYAH